MSYVRASESAARKADHIHIALHEDVEFHRITTGLEHCSISYEALPEINHSEVDTSISLFGKRMSMPLIISSMTGGTDEGKRYNRMFAKAAQYFRLAMGVGSQRIALEHPELADTFQVRDVAPDILLFANIGAVQLNNGCKVESCQRIVDMIGADALIIHINPLQECAQPEGDTNFRDIAEKIGIVCDTLEVPVIVKEVGHGISERTARLLAEAGVDAIDVAGAGGTSWAKVESYRGTRLGPSLGEWGISTLDSLIAARSVAPHATIISSGGIRTGEDIAKSIALGADAAAMALPLLKAASISFEALNAFIAQIREELSAVMFCAGVRTIEELRRAPVSSGF